MNNMPISNNRPEQGSAKCTFEIEVISQQNTTWQGSIHWMEKNQRQYFRSALEMIKLFDEALAEAAEDSRTVSWKRSG